MWKATEKHPLKILAKDSLTVAVGRSTGWESRVCWGTEWLKGGLARPHSSSSSSSISSEVENTDNSEMSNEINNLSFEHKIIQQLMLWIQGLTITVIFGLFSGTALRTLYKMHLNQLLIQASKQTKKQSNC